VRCDHNDVVHLEAKEEVPRIPGFGPSQYGICMNCGANVVRFESTWGMWDEVRVEDQDLGDVLCGEVAIYSRWHFAQLAGLVPYELVEWEPRDLEALERFWEACDEAEAEEDVPCGSG